MFDLNSKIKIFRIIGNHPYNRHMMKTYWQNNPHMKAKLRADIGMTTTGFPHCVMTWLDYHLLLEMGTLHIVMPTNWMTLPSYKMFIQFLKNHFIVRVIHLYDNAKKEVFDINMGDVVGLHLQKCSNKEERDHLNKRVKWRFNKEDMFIVDILKHDIIPLYQKPIDIDIIDKVLKNKKDNLCDHLRTNFFIEGAIVGLIKSLQHSKTWVNQQKHDAKTKFKMYFNTAAERDEHFSWYHTPVYNFALSLIKSSQKQQPATLDYIGLQDLKSLKFTNKELERIKRWRP